MDISYSNSILLVIHDLLQSYLLLNEVYPAVQAAAKCTEVNPLWWVGHQTLGRAQLGLGDVAMVGMKKSCMIFKGWEASNFLEARGFRGRELKVLPLSTSESNLTMDTSIF